MDCIEYHPEIEKGVFGKTHIQTSSPVIRKRDRNTCIINFKPVTFTRGTGFSRVRTFCRPIYLEIDE